MSASEIHFKCPGCIEPLRAPPTAVGAHAHCPHCNTAMEVPDPKKIAALPAGKEPIAEEIAVNLHEKDQQIEADMDMTPMVDVTFLLLIFFMVTASFSLQKSLQIPTPQKDEASTNKTVEEFEDDPETVVVRVDQYNTYRVITPEDEIECPSEQELLVQLRAARQSGSIKRLMVMAHGDARHDKVVFALDAGTAVGIEDVKITTVEDDDE